MKWLKLYIQYNGHFEGVDFPELHDEDADKLENSLDTVFSWFEDDNVQITWPETGSSSHVCVFTECYDGWPDDKRDYETF